MAVRIIVGDCREVLAGLPAGGVHSVVTSPPYWGLRDYGVEALVWGEWSGSLGLEPTPELYIEHIVEVFREVRRVLRDDGTLWLNIGDCYNAGRNGGWPGGKQQWRDDRYQNRSGANAPGLKPKDLVMMPARVALALQADGWWLRSDIIWSKPNPMPESVTDRPTSAHEHVFLLAKSARYFFDAEAVRESIESGSSDIKKMIEGKDRIGGKHKTLDDPLARASKHTNMGRKRTVGDPSGRNIRNVWEIATAPFPEAHFATFPPRLVEPCIKAGCPKGGLVLDPFAGAGTVGLVADRLGRDAVLIEAKPEYAEMARQRMIEDAGMFARIEVSEKA